MELLTQEEPQKEKHCVNCKNILLLRSRRPKPLRDTQKYFFTHYYWCEHCRKLYHDDKFRVDIDINKQDQKKLFRKKKGKEVMQFSINEIAQDHYKIAKCKREGKNILYSIKIQCRVRIKQKRC